MTAILLWQKTSYFIVKMLNTLATHRIVRKFLRGTHLDNTLRSTLTQSQLLNLHVTTCNLSKCNTLKGNSNRIANIVRDTIGCYKQQRVQYKGK